MSAGFDDEQGPPPGAAAGESLRERAEASVRADSALDRDVVPDVEAVLHELRVHQIELEMQNEELRRSQLELETMRAKYFDLYDMAPVGYVTTNDAGVVTEANLTAASLLGVDRSALVGAPMARFVFAEDADAYYLVLRRLAENGESLGFELRLRRSAQPFWARLHASLQPTSPEDETLETRVAFTDSDDLMHAQQAEQKTAAKLNAVLVSSHDIIYSVDAHGVITFVSPSWADLLGYQPREVIGSRMLEFVHPDDVPQTQQALAKMMKDSSAFTVVEYRVRRADGEWRWFESNIAPQLDPDGTVAEWVGNARDTTLRKLDSDQMKHLAMTDELTGIGNRRQFLAVAGSEFDRVRRDPHPLSLLMIDVDGLKTINDSYDHPMGDSVLQMVAGVCRDACGDCGAVGRLGGDEFAILLPGSDATAAHEVGERVRRGVEAMSGTTGLPSGLRLTVSVGVTEFEQGDAEFGQLLTRADHALQRAKRRGRNWTSM